MACRHGWVRLVCLLSVAHLGSPALASETEQRDFAVLVSGKEAGQSRLIITLEEDGTTVVAASAHVKFTQLLITYTYNIDSTEWWKDGKLIAFKSTCVENGKRTDVSGTTEGDRLKLRLNGQERPAAADAWTSSFWKLADARYHNKSVNVLEPDTAKEYVGQLQYVGTEQLTLLNQPQSCYHFRVTGGSYPVDVWFDRYHRLVRQEFIDTGHKTIIQLTSIRR